MYQKRRTTVSRLKIRPERLKNLRRKDDSRRKPRRRVKKLATAREREIFQRESAVVRISRSAPHCGLGYLISSDQTLKLATARSGIVPARRTLRTAFAAWSCILAAAVKTGRLLVRRSERLCKKVSRRRGWSLTVWRLRVLRAARSLPAEG